MDVGVHYTTNFPGVSKIFQNKSLGINTEKQGKIVRSCLSSVRRRILIDYSSLSKAEEKRGDPYCVSEDPRQSNRGK